MHDFSIFVLLIKHVGPCAKLDLAVPFTKACCMTPQIWPTVGHLATQALEALRKMRTETVQQAKEGKLMLEHLKTHRDNAARLRADMDNGERARASLQADIQAADADLARLHEVRPPCRLRAAAGLSMRFSCSPNIKQAMQGSCEEIMLTVSQHPCLC